MGRPKLRDEKKKVTVSISVSRGVAELAEKTDNQSHFFQTSVECSRSMRLVIEALRSKRMSLEEAMEEIGDVADVWAAEFDETVPFERTTEQTKKAARTAKKKAG